MGGIGFNQTLGVLVKGTDLISNTLTKAQRSIGGFVKSTEEAEKKTKKSGDGIVKSYKGIAIKASVTGAIVTGAFLLMANGASKFESSMAEVSTLVDTNVVDMGLLTDQVKDISREYGSMPISTAKSLYTTISAGFTGAADSTMVLDGALKLAKGGITTTEIAIDGLTSNLNAYGLGADKVGMVSDWMFTAMKAGKTTIGELSGALGAITPIAASVGVGLDQVLAGTAALTLAGKSTSESVTGLRGIMAAVLKPTSEATKAAKRLGVDFSVSALKAKGLSGFLADIKVKTKGDSEVIAEMFGRLEGLGAVMALAGKQGGKFNEILGQMKTSSGATDEALDKIKKTSGYAFSKAKVSATLLKDEIGTALLPLLSKVAIGFGKVFDGITAFAKANPILTKIITISGLVIGAVLSIGGAFLTASIAVSAAAAFMGFSISAAIWPVTLVVAGITALVAAGYYLSKKAQEDGSIINRVWTGIKDVFWSMANPIILGFKLISKIVSEAWGAVATDTATAWPLMMKAFKPFILLVKTSLLPLFAMVSASMSLAWGLMKTSTKFIWGLIGSLVVTGVKIIYSTVKMLWHLISGTVKGGLKLITGDWAGGIQVFKDMTKNLGKDVEELLQSLTDSAIDLGMVFYDAGAGLIGAMWSGMKSGWEVLKNGFVELLDTLNPFMPHSDAKMGPLSHLTASGRAVPETFAEGITRSKSAPVSAIKPMLSSIKLDAVNASPVASDGGTVTNVSNSKNSSSKSVTFSKGSVVLKFDNVKDLNNLDEEEFERKLINAFSKTASALGA